MPAARRYRLQRIAGTINAVSTSALPSFCSLLSLEEVFEGQVEQDRPVSAAGAHADRHPDTRHDLKAAGVVVRPSYPRADEKARGAVRSARCDHGLVAAPESLRQDVEFRPQPD